MNKIATLIAFLAVALIGSQLALGKNDAMEALDNDKTTETAVAVFAGGCFWCTESDFEKADGVIEAVSGYTGGHLPRPSYEQVSAGGTGHVEAVRVTYDPSRTNYDKLLDVFWRHVDPTDPGGQFVDRGDQYRSVIFYAGKEEQTLAEASKRKLAATGPFEQPIATKILPLGEFYPAEDYHQDYYKRNPIRYQWYRSGSGRDRFLASAWADWKPPMEKGEMAEGGKKVGNMSSGLKKEMKTERMKMEKEPAMKKPPKKDPAAYTRPTDEELKQRLTPLQYEVTRNEGTEPPFNNRYWDNHARGIYVDIVSGEPLFSSEDKFDSGTGWPSFSRPLEAANIVEKTDRSLFMVRTEVRSRHGDSHLGHLFTDGPAPTGLRYCINSASLRFIPVKNLQAEGYGEYLGLFDGGDS